MLKIDNLSCTIGKRSILRNLSLFLSKGEICTLIGSSGSGKTTLLRTLCGLVTQDSGEIEIAGSAALEACRQIQYMTQEDHLLPWKSVLKNVMLPLELGHGKKCKNHCLKDAIQSLHDVGLGDVLDSYPHQLSGGMRQRVSLARALLQNKPLLLLDEPFTALDVVLREQMHLLIRSLCKKNKITVFMVTHDFRDAVLLSDKICLLSDGRISQEWAVPTDLTPDSSDYESLVRELRSSM